MRSLVLALALVAPVGAVAATPTPTYGNPMTTVHQQKVQVVFLTFVNHTAQNREVRIGDKQYKIRYGSILHAYAPVGSVVRVYCDSDTKVNGQELMQVSSSDAGKSVFLK